MRVPVLAGYLVSATAAGAWLGLTTLRDDVVDEQVVMAAAAAPAPARAGRRAGRRAPRPSPPTSGSRAAGSARASTRPRAPLPSCACAAAAATSRSPRSPRRRAPTCASGSSRGDTLDGGAPGAVDLGALKGNKGDQQYRLPAGTAVRGRSVVIWCRAFSAPFGGALLR